MTLTMLESSRLDKTIAPRRTSGVLLAGVSGRLQDVIQRVLSRYRASVECFATVEDCLAVLDRHPYDLLVVCLDDDADRGCELVTRSRCARPLTPILALVKPGDVSRAVRTMKTGATNCLETSAKTAELRSALVDLISGPGARIRSTLGLTKTESLVLAHILAGRTNQETAGALHRSPRTVEVHRQKVMHKLGASNTVTLLKRAFLLGLAPSNPPLAQEDGARLAEA